MDKTKLMSDRLNYIIGDIHGCYDEFLNLEEKISDHSAKNESQPFIISVGDLIDRGEKSKDVIDHFMKGTENNTHLAVMGNHELLMIQALKEFAAHNYTEIEYPDWLYTYNHNFKEKRGVSILCSWENYITSTKNIWLNQGGISTLESFGCDPFDSNTWIISKEVLEYMVNLPFYYETENFIITHALPYPQDLETFKNTDVDNRNSIYYRDAGHSLIWNRLMPNEIICEGKLHISGHTPMQKARRTKKANSIQIDTSCVFGGRLSAYCIETNELISVKSNKIYVEL